MCPACLPGRALHVRVLASIKTALAGEETGLRKNSLRSPCAQGPPLKMDRAAAEKKTFRLPLLQFSFNQIMHTCITFQDGIGLLVHEKMRRRAAWSSCHS